MISPVADVLGLDPEALGDWALGLATFLGAAIALLGLANAMRSWYRRTLGRRRESYERLARLGTRARILFFESVLGEPAAIWRSVPTDMTEYRADGVPLTTRRILKEHIFIDRDFFVQALCDEEETVLAFSVTTRAKRFQPAFAFPPRPNWKGRRDWKKRSGTEFRHLYEVTLGKTRFDRLGGRPKRRALLGARTWSYTELVYFGNPGQYQHFGFTASSASPAGKVGPIGEVVKEIGRDWNGEDPGAENPNAKSLRLFRREVAVTTFTIIGPGLNPDDYLVTFGPHGDDVRTLP